MIRRPPTSTLSSSSAASDVYKRQEEISNHINHLSKWTRPKKVKSPMVHFISKSRIYPEPFGNVLIFGTWNYPFQINLVPLIGAISAGNCAIIKPSEFTPHSSALLD